jgi:hypothetical protein
MDKPYPTYSEIYWLGDRFHCNNEKLEAAHELVLESNSNAKHICEKMQNLGFDLDTICVDIFPKKPFPKGLSFYPKTLSIFEDGFTIEQQGTGFNVCFNLIGYAVAANGLGLALRIYGGSFQGCLHPLLYKALESYFQSGSIGIYKECPYFANSEYLKCTVNPAIPCKQCDESPQLFKNAAIEWIKLGTWQHILKYQELEGRQIAAAKTLLSDTSLPQI